MRPYLLMLFLLCTAALPLRAQYVYTIKADSVKITNHCDTAELILENHTQNVLGFLYNKGRGRTEFRKVVKLDHSTLLFGEDTLVVGGNVLASNGLSKNGNIVQLGQSLGAEGDPAALQEDREIPLNGYALRFKYQPENSEIALFPFGPAIELHGGSTGAMFLVSDESTGRAGIMQKNALSTMFGGNGFLQAFDLSNNLAIANSSVRTDNGNKFQVYGTTYFDNVIRLNTVQDGTKDDSVLVLNSSNKTVYKISQSSIANSIYRVAVNDANYTATSSSYPVAYVSITTGRTVTLPSASSMSGKTLIVKDESGGAGIHNITVDGFGSETIDGVASKTVSTNFGSIILHSNGSAWFTIHQ